MSLADSDLFEEVGIDETSGEPTDGTGTPQPPAAPQYRKQGFSVYSVMLILSFVFLVTAMILLFQEVGRLNN